MAIAGQNVKDTNSLFRMFMVVFAGIMAFAVLLSWRAQVLFNAEYADTSVRPHKLQAATGTPSEHNELIKEELKPESIKE